MAEILLSVLVLAILGYHAWETREHRKQLDRLALLIKSKDVPEFLAAVPPKSEEAAIEQPQDDSVPIEDVSPEETLEALRKE